MLFVVSVFSFLHLLPVFIADPTSLFITETERSVSKDGILLAIRIFKIYNAVVAACGFLIFTAALRAFAGLVPVRGRIYAAAVYLFSGTAACFLFFGWPGAYGYAAVLVFAALAVCLDSGAGGLCASDQSPNRLMALLACIPWLPEAACPRLIFYSRYGRLCRAGFLSSAVSALICAAALVISGPPGFQRYLAGFKRLAAGNFYGISVENGRVMACEVLSRKISSFPLTGRGPAETLAVNTRRELQQVKFNPARGEAYHFDKQRGALLVLDGGSLAVKRAIEIPGLGYGGSAISDFDNSGGTLAVALEDSPLLVFRLGSFALRSVLRGTEHTEFILYDRAAGSYLVSFYKGRDTFEAISADGKIRRQVAAGRFQGGMALSEKRKELYLAMPLQGRILVFDSATLEQKGWLRSVYGVRGLACDDKNGVLVAASMCGGFAEAINLEDGRRVARIRAGYYLRELALDPEARTAFVTSMLDGVVSFKY
jgi:hypothetical protein